MAMEDLADRRIRLDLGPIAKDDGITATMADETFSGPVTRIDTYGDTVDVERVVQFNMSYKHKIDGPDWEPWRAYLVEEPAGIYRLNILLHNGDVSRSRNLDAPDEIVVE